MATATDRSERVAELERMLAKSRVTPGYAGRAKDIEAEIERLKGEG